MRRYGPMVLMALAAAMIGNPLRAKQYLVCVSGRATLWEDVYWADGTRDGAQPRAEVGYCALGPWWTELDVYIPPRVSGGTESPRPRRPGVARPRAEVGSPEPLPSSRPPASDAGEGRVPGQAAAGSSVPELAFKPAPPASEITALLQRAPRDLKPVEPGPSQWQVEAELLKHVRGGTLPTVRIDGETLPEHVRRMVAGPTRNEGR